MISRSLFICLLWLLLGQVANAVADPSETDETISPPFHIAAELTVASGTPRGTVHQFTIKSEDSKIYPGISKKQPGVVVPYERKVAVYVPANYTAGTAAPFIVVQDGIGYVNNVVPVLDNLISQKKLPAMVAVFINSGGGDAQGSERGLEYDTLSDKYTMFVETEVLPKISHDYQITFTKDPEGRATMGGSSGAACAFTMGWFHPELYRKILSYSGTFVNQQSPMNPDSLRGAWEYHATLVPNNAAKPLRVWLEVGENDNGSKKDEASLHNWVLANHRMAAALKAKGYQSRFVFAEGAGHVDGRVVKQTLPDALLWLWKGYPIN